MNKTLLKSAHSATILSLGLIFGSCNVPDTTPPNFTTPVKIEQNPNPSVPLAGVVSFATDEPVETSIQVSDGQNEWILEYDQTQEPKQGLPVIGMRANRFHKISVVVRDLAGNETKAQSALTFTTPPLPVNTDKFPPLDVTVQKTEEMEQGITLLSVRRRKAYKEDLRGDPTVTAFNQKFGMLLAVDHQGEPIWYYQQDSRISDFEVLDNGNIVYLTQDYRAIEIDWLGNTVKTWYAQGRPKGSTEGISIKSETLHHDIYDLPNNNLAVLGTQQRTIENYYTSETDPHAPRKTQQVLGDKILEFTRDGEIVWEWNTFDHLDVFHIGYETFGGYWERRGFPGVLD